MADDEKQGETSAGRPRRVSDEAIINAIQTAISEQDAPIATTPDLEDRLALSRRGLQKRLRDLRERGLLGSRAVGSGRVWWVPSTDSSQENHES